jgi:hypothetical protein
MVQGRVAQTQDIPRRADLRALANRSRRAVVRVDNVAFCIDYHDPDIEPLHRIKRSGMRQGGTVKSVAQV